MNKFISEHISDDGLKTAIILLVDSRYAIEFYEQTKHIYTLLCTESSLNAVEDTAEDYVLGTFNSIKDYQ
jgi:hypothetical protein